MPCYGTVTPSDLREPTIEIVCERCARRERYSVASLIAAPGTDAKLSGCCPVFCCGRVAAELLAKQSLDIGLVVNDENERVQWTPLGFKEPPESARGNRITKLVEPGSLSTSIEPPCCLTTMS